MIATRTTGEADKGDSPIMTNQQIFGTSRTIRRAGLVILIVLILAAVIVNGTRSRSDTNTEASSIGSCTDIKAAEVARSEDLLRASLSGTITATASELRGVQAERSVMETERSTKEGERTTNKADLKREERARKSAQKVLTEKVAESQKAQSDLSTENEKLRAAEEANDDQEQIDALTGEIARLEKTIASLGEEISTLNESIAGRSETIGSLTEAIATLDAEIVTLDADIDSLVRRETALETTLESKYLARSAMLVADTRRAEAQVAQTELKAKKDEARAAKAANEDEQLIDALSGEIQLLELTISSLNDPIWALDAESEDEISGAYLPPRSDVNLVPAVPVSRIDLGSHRATSKVEIVLTSASFGAGEEPSAATQDETAAFAARTELPDKAEYFTEAVQFRRSEGNAIPTEQISVWARRVGTVVIMSVCIEPDGLDPGMYAGDVYLVDPSLNPTKVRVEVTAQSQWINLLYVLLLVLPVLALAYVWITARYSAGQDPWNHKHLKKWLEQNSVAVLVVGFAAVWATLQVPFNNPTWGTSWLTSAAVVGVGLVAAVTAMTVVAGKVVGEQHSGDSSGQVADTNEDAITTPQDQ